MPENNQIETAIREFLFTKFPLAQSRQLEDHDSLLDGGIIDSMGVLELVDFIEEEFGIVLTDDEVASDTFESIASLAGLVRNRRKADASVATEH